MAENNALIRIPDDFIPDLPQRHWLAVHMDRVDAAVERYRSRQPYYGRPLPEPLTDEQLEKLNYNNWM